MNNIEALHWKRAINKVIRIEDEYVQRNLLYNFTNFIINTGDDTEEEEEEEDEGGDEGEEEGEEV